MGHIRKKVNLRIIYFAFLFLFEFLHLPTMLPVAASLEIHNRIQRTTYNQQSIHDISPDGKIERRKNMYFQGYSLFIPYPVAIRDFHPESVIAIPQVGVSDDRLSPTVSQSASKPSSLYIILLILGAWKSSAATRKEKEF